MAILCPMVISERCHMSFPLFSSSNPAALCRQLLLMLSADPVFQEFRGRGVAERGVLSFPLPISRGVIPHLLEDKIPGEAQYVNLNCLRWAA
jgi:hypothetical protein